VTFYEAGTGNLKFSALCVIFQYSEITGTANRPTQRPSSAQALGLKLLAALPLRQDESALIGFGLGVLVSLGH